MAFANIRRYMFIALVVLVGGMFNVGKQNLKLMARVLDDYRLGEETLVMAVFEAIYLLARIVIYGIGVVTTIKWLGRS